MRVRRSVASLVLAQSSAASSDDLHGLAGRHPFVGESQSIFFLFIDTHFPS
jgi:hypothetical protein